MKVPAFRPEPEPDAVRAAVRCWLEPSGRHHRRRRMIGRGAERS